MRQLLESTPIPRMSVPLYFVGGNTVFTEKSGKLGFLAK
jgi:hypothetical protein